MLCHKLRAAGHLAFLLLWGNVRGLMQGLSRGPRAALLAGRQSFVLMGMALWAGLCQRGKFRVARIVKLCQAGGIPRSVLEKNLEAAVALAERDIRCQKFERAVAILSPHIERAGKHPKAAKCHGMRSLAHIWHGRYRETVADLDDCAELRPCYARGFNYLANLAQVQGMRGEVEAARRAMAAQCGAKPGQDPSRYLARFLRKRLSYLFDEFPHETVGVMFGSYHTAFGHAILDPFHFYNLFRHRYDRLLVIHPPLAHYSRPTLLMVDIMRQSIEQIDTGLPEITSFAWQNLGRLRIGRIAFLCYNYWSLNRMAFRARQNPGHPMSQGRRYVELPPRVVDRAESICRKNRIDLSRPVVVLHTRGHSYHRLRGQLYRNVDARNYVPAVQRLLDLGYQVVRIGDRNMESIRAAAPGLIELPFLKVYDHTLDAYFLSRCRFMISSQSGPCSLARALGKPNLVINAVYHHTMLPEFDELFCFKQYRDERGRALSVEEILARGGHLFDRSSHFEDAGLHLEDATAEEIRAATEERLATLDDPHRVDTPVQREFRLLMQRFGAEPPDHPLANRMSDYIGYSLPEGRVSDSVCRMREGYVMRRRTVSAM